MSDLSPLRPHTSPPDVSSLGSDHITILLATFNGAETLNEQLESLSRQTHENWSLIVSDDGSSDQTPDIVGDFTKRHPEKRVTLLPGPARGSAQNFLSLLRVAGNAPFVAFCDQDDVWFDTKLERAFARLGQTIGPAIYGSTTMITDRDLNPLRPSLKFQRAPDFKNALVQNIAGGNTMVINRAALDVLQPASLKAARIMSHDWWCYQMVTGIGGRMFYDTEPSLYYRQHATNQIGANDTLRAKILRLRRLVCGDFAQSLNCHFHALRESQECMTPAARHVLARCYHLSSNHVYARLYAFWTSGIYRQTFPGTLALSLAVLTGRL